MEYIVLRASPLASAEDANIQLTGARDRQPEFSIEAATIDSEAQLADNRRDPAIRAMAPVMPTALIEPVSRQEGTVSQVWGIDAVGCNHTPYTGAGVKLAILDTGIFADHPAFRGRKPECRNFTLGKADDTTGHGTHCAGTIFGRSVKGRRIGVAPGIDDVMVGKVIDKVGGDTRMLFEALSWAIAGGANIITLSLGLNIARMIEDTVGIGLPRDIAASRVLDAYRDNLRLFDNLMAIALNPSPFSGGAVVLAAVGNDSRAGQDPRFRASTTLPAAALNVLSVGALERSTQGLMTAPFSNASPEICAPGVDVFSAALDGGLVSMSGTSMACPHAAGVAALWWEAVQKQGYGTKTAAVVRERLLSSASLDGLAESTFELRGRGIVQAPGANLQI